MLKIGDVVTFYDPGSKREHESWSRGKIVRTLIRHTSGSPAVHVVKIDGFKWDKEADWGPYDGVPECIGRERDGNPELEFIDTWPRRNRK